MNTFFAGVLAATVWMAPDGNDVTGDGSKEKPVATLQKAVDTNIKLILSVGSGAYGLYVIAFNPSHIFV